MGLTQREDMLQPTGFGTVVTCGVGSGEGRTMHSPHDCLLHLRVEHGLRHAVLLRNAHVHAVMRAAVAHLHVIVIPLRRLHLPCTLLQHVDVVLGRTMVHVRLPLKLRHEVPLP